jgi:single-strand DNA-binding protein
MKSVNKIILVGNVAADPESRQTNKGETVTTFPLATERDFTSNGEKKKVTDFHRVVAWGKLGEICAKYLEKGKAVYVEGLVLNRAYEEEGERRYVTEIRAEEVNMLSFKVNREREQLTINPLHNEDHSSHTEDAH